jgi:hypothetical protein
VTFGPNEMLFVGQLLAHLRQILQKSSTPRSIGPSAIRGMSVRIGSGMWMRAPNRSEIIIPLRPSSPRPAARPAPCGFTAPRIAVYPISLMYPSSAFITIAFFIDVWWYDMSPM